MYYSYDTNAIGVVKGDTSNYYKYLVDEKAGTYELVEEFNVACSSIVSSVQDAF